MGEKSIILPHSFLIPECIKCEISELFLIQSKAHKVLQSDNTETIDHIQKCFREKLQCSRWSSFWTTLFFMGRGAEDTSRSIPLF